MVELREMMCKHVRSICICFLPLLLLCQLIATDEGQESEEVAGSVIAELLHEDELPPLWINSTEEAIFAGIDVEAMLFELCLPKSVTITNGHFS